MPLKISLRNRANKNGKCNIVCTYRYKQEPRFQFPAKDESGESIRIPCEYWDKSKSRVRRSYPLASVINKRLSALEEEAESIVQEIQFLEKKPPGVSVFRQKWESKHRDSAFFSAWEKFVQYKRKARVSQNSLFSYSSTERRLREFQELTGKIYFSRLDQNFVDRYSDFVLSKVSPKTGRKLKPSTLSLDFRILKVFLKFGLIRKMHSNQDFQVWETIKVKNTKGPESWLTPIEVFKIKSLHLEGKIEEYRDTFLLLCNTGLRISEYRRLTQESLDRRLNIISYGKSKNEDKSNRIIVGSEVVEFFDKYPKLPKVTTEDMNTTFLPEITRLAGIDKHVTTHHGRRTCVNISTMAGIPISEISKTVGHSSEDVTKRSYQDDASIPPAVGPKLLGEYMRELEEKGKLA